MGDYLPPPNVDTTVVEQCDVEVTADADQVAYGRGADLGVCLDVDLGQGDDTATVTADADVDVDQADQASRTVERTVDRDDGLEVL